MSNVVIYDSQFGNTAKIAQAIAQSLKAKAILVSDVQQTDVEKADLLIVGSPTQGGRPTAVLQSFIDQLPSLKNVKVAAFDTRFEEATQNFALKTLMKTIGYAAPKIAKSLAAKGGTLMAEPAGFIVTGKEGSLAEGELTRAKRWLQ